jgi:hypothetical protein
MHRSLAAVLALLAFATCGCGRRDPVQLELREYQRTVVGAITEDEERFSAELAAADEAHPKGDVPDEALLAVFRDKLLPIYEGILARAKAHKPRAAQIGAVHAELVGFYAVGVDDLKRCVEALTARDGKALAEVQQEMSARDADGLVGRLERLYAKHKLAIE